MFSFIRRISNFFVIIFLCLILPACTWPVPAEKGAAPAPTDTPTVSPPSTDTPTTTPTSTPSPTPTQTLTGTSSPTPTASLTVTSALEAAIKSQWWRGDDLMVRLGTEGEDFPAGSYVEIDGQRYACSMDHGDCFVQIEDLQPDGSYRFSVYGPDGWEQDTVELSVLPQPTPTPTTTPEPGDHYEEDDGDGPSGSSGSDSGGGDSGDDGPGGNDSGGGDGGK